MKKTLVPSTNKRDRIYGQPKKDQSFPYGVIKDTSAPKGSLAEGKNVSVHPVEIKGRTGSVKYGEAEIPAIAGKSNYIAYKTDGVITTTNKTFEQSDVSNFFVWPGRPGENNTHDEIIQFLSATQVRVESDIDQTLTSGGYIRGKVNVNKFHQLKKYWIKQFQKLFYYAEIALDEYVNVLTISRNQPSNAKGDYSNLGEHASLVYNSNGIYRLDYTSGFSYQINCPVPDVEILGRDSDQGYSAAYRYRYSAARMDGTLPIRDRLTPCRIQTETGTNTESVEGNAAGLDRVWQNNSITEDNPAVVGPLWVPKVLYTDPQEYQWHYSHFPIYRTMDIQSTPDDPHDSTIYNDPNRFVWTKDLRICGAFLASIDDGIVTAEVGEFEIADVGSMIEWEDGERDEIRAYVSSTQVRISLSSYGGIDRPLRAGAIGNGRVFRGSQTGNLVTRTHGNSFTSADLRKTLTWSTGFWSVITEFIDANTVRVHNNVDQIEQGLTTDPTYRMFNDTTTDFVLRSRILPDLLLRQRFWTPLPNCNIGRRVPGFVVVAVRNDNIYYYSQEVDIAEFLIGYYNASMQLSKEIDEGIQHIEAFPDKFVIWTPGKTYHVPTNVPGTVELPDIGDTVSTLPKPEILDGDKGLFDWGSIQSIGNGKYRLLTSEPGFTGMRDFNGTSYGPNMQYDPSTGLPRMARDLNNIERATCSIYNGDEDTGCIFWGKDK